MNKNKGSVLYFSVMILTIILSIVLGMSAMLITQIKMIRGTEFSVMAFYLADSGIEEALYCLYKGGCSSDEGDIIPNNRLTSIPNYGEYRYELVSGEFCRPIRNFYCIISTGIFQGTRRSIEVGN